MKLVNETWEKNGRKRQFKVIWDRMPYMLGSRSVGLSVEKTPIFKRGYYAVWVKIHLWKGDLVFHYLKEK